MKARTCITGAMIAAFSTLAAGSATASEQPLYDRRIEEAVIRILQPKLGDMRGGFGLEPQGHIYPPLAWRGADGDRSPWLDLVDRPKMARISWN